MPNKARLIQLADALEAAGRIDPDAVDELAEAAKFIAGLAPDNSDDRNRVNGEADDLHELANELRETGPLAAAWGELARTVSATQDEGSPDDGAASGT